MSGLDWQVSLLVLLAAFLHAAWNALVKSGRDRILTVGTVSAVGMGVSLVALPFFPAPARESWPYLALGVLTHGGFKAFLLLAYGKGELSRVYPMARGVAPLLVALFSGVAAGEVLHGREWVGVALICAGLAVLALENGLPGRGERAALVYSVLTGVFIAAYTLVDGVGIRRSGSPFGYTAWLFFLDGLPMITGALVLRWRSLRMFLASGALPALSAGSLSLAAYVVVLWALNRGAMAPIAALRETGVIFAALIGTFVLGERLGRRRVLAAAIVAVGVATLSL